MHWRLSFLLVCAFIGISTGVDSAVLMSLTGISTRDGGLKAAISPARFTALVPVNIMHQRVLRLAGGRDSDEEPVYEENGGRESWPDPGHEFHEENVRGLQARRLDDVELDDEGNRVQQGTPRGPRVKIPTMEEEYNPAQQQLRSGEAARDGPDNERAREEEAMRQQLLGRVLSKAAYERLNNVISVDPNHARAVSDRVIGMARSGQLLQEMTDAQLERIMKGTKKSRTTTNSQIKYQRRSSLLDTIGLDPAYARKLGIETEGWDAPLEEELVSELSDYSVPGSEALGNPNLDGDGQGYSDDGDAGAAESG